MSLPRIKADAAHAHSFLPAGSLHGEDKVPGRNVGRDGGPTSALDEACFDADGENGRLAGIL